MLADLNTWAIGAVAPASFVGKCFLIEVKIVFDSARATRTLS
jgi:hypothetical protein